jgi:hypothetical protein
MSLPHDRYLHVSFMVGHSAVGPRQRRIPTDHNRKRVLLHDGSCHSPLKSSFWSLRYTNNVRKCVYGLSRLQELRRCFPTLARHQDQELKYDPVIPLGTCESYNHKRGVSHCFPACVVRLVRPFGLPSLIVAVADSFLGATPVERGWLQLILKIRLPRSGSSLSGADCSHSVRFCFGAQHSLLAVPHWSSRHS